MTEYIISMSAETITKNEDGATARITPNMQEIVRCRDCVKGKESIVYGKLFCHRFSMCDGAGFPVEPDGFCKWGERE